MAGCIAMGSLNATAEPLVHFIARHEPMDVQFHYMIDYQWSSTQYEWNIEREQLLKPHCKYFNKLNAIKIIKHY